MTPRWKTWVTAALAALIVGSVVGYIVWYELTMDAWRAAHVHPEAGVVEQSSDVGPGTTGVSRGGQFFPTGLYVGLPLLILVMTPILLAIWWRPWRGRPVDEGRPPWLERGRRLAVPGRGLISVIGAPVAP